MGNITCRGSFALGTACGMCSKCSADIDRYNAGVNLREALNPPTTAQIMADPKVQALVEAGEVMAKALRGDYIVPKSASNWRAALAALEDKP